MKTLNRRAKLVLLAVLAFLFVFVGPAAGQSIELDEEDEFTGDRVVRSSFESVDHDGFSGRARMSVAYIGDSYALTLLTRSRDSWQFLNSDKAYFIIDEARVTHDLDRLGTETTRGAVIEHYAFLLTPEELLQIAGGTDVRFRAAGNIFTVGESTKANIQLVLDAVEG